MRRWCAVDGRSSVLTFFRSGITGRFVYYCASCGMTTQNRAFKNYHVKAEPR